MDQVFKAKSYTSYFISKFSHLNYNYQWHLLKLVKKWVEKSKKNQYPLHLDVGVYIGLSDFVWYGPFFANCIQFAKKMADFWQLIISLILVFTHHLIWLLEHLRSAFNDFTRQHFTSVAKEQRVKCRPAWWPSMYYLIKILGFLTSLLSLLWLLSVLNVIKNCHFLTPYPLFWLRNTWMFPCLFAKSMNGLR